MKRMIKLMLLVVMMLIFPPFVFASNPIIKTDEDGSFLFTADVAAFVDGNTVYLYAGYDETVPNGNILRQLF